MAKAALKVPMALDTANNLIDVGTAQKGERYYCPACRTILIFKAGAIRTRHFSHKPTDTCNQETIIHKTAKLLIQRTIAEWKAGNASAPTLRRICSLCFTLNPQALPDKVDESILEYRLVDGYIVDVALLVKGKAEGAIEIRVTHAVDEIKAKSISIPFIEIEGTAVLENPIIWTPIIDSFRPFTCSTCNLKIERFRTLTKQIALESNIELPISYYRYKPDLCWKCNKNILVFTWPGKQMHSKIAPCKQPFPRSVRFEYSKTIYEKYWANTCPYCKAIQGDWFSHFACGEDTPNAFRDDLKEIASSMELDDFE